MRASRSLGFALLDLLAVTSVALLLTGILTVWSGLFAQKRNSVFCLANGRQMMRAFALYAQDHDGLLPPNEQTPFPGHSWFAASSGSSAELLNPLLAGDPHINLLARFASDLKIWKCPADPATIVSQGKRIRTARSVAMNGAVGTVCSQWPDGHSGAPELAQHGPWLDGMNSHSRGETFRTFGRESDFVQSAVTLVFVDEHPPSMNEGSFNTPGYDTQERRSTVRWVDFPATYHGSAGGVTFADGHAEIHRWRDLRFPATSLPSDAVLQRQRKDWEWLGTHVTQPLR